MTPPRDSRGRFVRAPRPHRCRRTSSSPSARRAAGQLAAAATRLRQPLNGRPTSILIAALDDLPVMRMTVSDADDPAAAKRARWARNSARRRRRRRRRSKVCCRRSSTMFRMLRCPGRPRQCAAAGPCPSLGRAGRWPPTRGPPLGRPWSRRRLSACGWPARSVPAPKSEYLL